MCMYILCIHARMYVSIHSLSVYTYTITITFTCTCHALIIPTLTCSLSFQEDAGRLLSGTLGESTFNTCWLTYLKTGSSGDTLLHGFILWLYSLRVTLSFRSFFFFFLRLRAGMFFFFNLLCVSFQSCFFFCVCGGCGESVWFRMAEVVRWDFQVSTGR